MDAKLKRGSFLVGTLLGIVLGFGAAGVGGAILGILVGGAVFVIGTALVLVLLESQRIGVPLRVYLEVGVFAALPFLSIFLIVWLWGVGKL